MLKRISERGHRIGSAYALTTFARLHDGYAEDVEAYLSALPTGADSPFARIGTLHIARVQLFRALVHQGPKQSKTDTLAERAPRLHEHDRRRRWTRTWSSCAELVPECDEWWGRCVGYPGRADAGAFRGWVRSIQARPGLFRSAMPNATVAEVHEALALREQVIDFAVDAQGMDAETLRARFRGTF